MRTTAERDDTPEPGRTRAPDAPRPVSGTTEPRRGAVVPPGMGSPAGVVAMQRMVGNGAVTELLQRAASVAQRRETPNRTGLPDGLKEGVEELSGVSMDDVRVHYGSPAPARLGALAYAQGTEIHLGRGQERHLAHEAWHVVQQKQGRVAATVEVGGAAVNDDPGLEREADAMGLRAASVGPRAVQRRTDEGSVRVGMEPAPEERAAGSGAPARHLPIQAMLVKVTTTRPPASALGSAASSGPAPAARERVISSVEFEGRVPTTVAGGQGDHTVAETLAQQALIRACRGKTHAAAAVELRQMLAHLDATAQARVGLEKRRLGFGEVAARLAEYARMASDPTVEGEDRNTALEAFLEDFLRLWNKTPGTAYPRSAARTAGGGNERAAIGTLRDIDRATSSDGAEEYHIPDLARHTVELLDFLPAAPMVTWAEVVGHVSRAVELAFSAVPEMELYNQDVALATAHAFALKHGMSAAQEGRLKDDVLERISPRSDDETCEEEADMMCYEELSEEEDSGAAAHPASAASSNR